MLMKHFALATLCCVMVLRSPRLYRDSEPESSKPAVATRYPEPVEEVTCDVEYVEEEFPAEEPGLRISPQG